MNVHNERHSPLVFFPPGGFSLLPETQTSEATQQSSQEDKAEEVSAYHLVVNVKSRLGLDGQPDLNTLAADLDVAEKQLETEFPGIKSRMPAEGLSIQDLCNHANLHRERGEAGNLASCLIGLIVRLRSDIKARGDGVNTP